MRRPLRPLWLAHPTRFAALSGTAARVALALAVLLMAATGLAFDMPAAHPQQDVADAILAGTVVDALRHGGEYYSVTADTLRAANAPMHPFVAFPLPTLARVQAMLPPWASLALLWSLAVAAALAWYARLAPAFARARPRVVAAVLLAAGFPMLVQPGLLALPDVWAGLLVALSLALRRPSRWIEAAAIGLAACLIRESAALYVAVMAVLAFAEGRRREALGWAAALAVLAAALAAHAQAVAQVVQPLDPGPAGWSDTLGFGLFVRSMTASTALAPLPVALSAPLVGLALLGWSAWRDPLALRTLATLALYAALIGVAGGADTALGFLVAPILLVGLAFVPDALRDLLGAARDTRRITVRRVTR